MDDATGQNTEKHRCTHSERGPEDNSDGVAMGTSAAQMVVIRAVRDARGRAKKREPARGSWENRARHYQLERGWEGRGYLGRCGNGDGAEMVVTIQPVGEKTGLVRTKRKQDSKRHSLAGEASGVFQGCCDWDGFFWCAGSNGAAGDRKVFHSLSKLNHPRGWRGRPLKLEWNPARELARIDPERRWIERRSDEARGEVISPRIRRR